MKPTGTSSMAQSTSHSESQPIEPCESSGSSGSDSGALPSRAWSLQKSNNVISIDDRSEDLDGPQNHQLEDVSNLEITMDICDSELESDDDNESSGSESDCSYSSSEDEVISKLHSFQTAPLFVLPSSSEMFISDITHYEHLLAVNALATSGNLSSRVLENVLDLIKLHVPDNNLCEENVNDLKKS